VIPAMVTFCCESGNLLAGRAGWQHRCSSGVVASQEATTPVPPWCRSGHPDAFLVSLRPGKLPHQGDIDAADQPRPCRSITIAPATTTSETPPAGPGPATETGLSPNKLNPPITDSVLVASVNTYRAYRFQWPGDNNSKPH
jgi:hypothetical protein